MTDLWAALLPILLADVVNPVLFAFMVYAAGTKQPLVNSTSMLLGHTAAYFSVGVVLLFSLDAIANRLANPQPIDFVIETLVGIGLLRVALRSRSDRGKRPEEPGPQLTPVTSFLFGAVVNFIGIPFALPYFAALGQMAKAELTFTEDLVALAAYNLAYAMPFVVVPLLRAVLGNRSQAVLHKINEVLDRISGVLMPVVLFLIGIALLADAVYYFTTGNVLINIDG
ncbi:MAG: GAP family protein [Gammaproteobacteria bacterium]|nr:GAP family protein [Gammaproteobacteria bacterium]